jgi:hypothetical protein
MGISAARKQLPLLAIYDCAGTLVVALKKYRL